MTRTIPGRKRDVRAFRKETTLKKGQGMFSNDTSFRNKWKLKDSERSLQRKSLLSRGNANSIASKSERLRTRTC